MRIRTPWLIVSIAVALAGACGGVPSSVGDAQPTEGSAASPPVEIDLAPFAVHLSAPHQRNRSLRAFDETMQMLENDIAHCVLANASGPVPDDDATVEFSVERDGGVATWSVVDAPASPVVGTCIAERVPALRLPPAIDTTAVTAQLRYRPFTPGVDTGRKLIEFDPLPLVGGVELDLRDDAIATLVGARHLAVCQRPAADRSATDGRYRIDLAVDGDGIPVDVTFDRVDGALEPAVERCVDTGLKALRFGSGPRREIRTDVHLYGTVEWPLAVGDVAFPPRGRALVGVGFSHFEAIGTIADLAPAVRRCVEEPSSTTFLVVWDVLPPGVVERVSVTGDLDAAAQSCVERAAAGVVFPATSIFTEVTAPWGDSSEPSAGD